MQFNAKNWNLINITQYFKNCRKAANFACIFMHSKRQFSWLFCVLAYFWQFWQKRQQVKTARQALLWVVGKKKLSKHVQKPCRKKTTVSCHSDSFDHQSRQDICTQSFHSNNDFEAWKTHCQNLYKKSKSNLISTQCGHFCEWHSHEL